MPINRYTSDVTNNNLRKSNVIMGDDKVDYTSETRNLYKSVDMKNNDKSAGIVMNKGEDARKSHLEIMKGKGNYLTNYQST